MTRKPKHYPKGTIDVVALEESDQMTKKNTLKAVEACSERLRQIELKRGGALSMIRRNSWYGPHSSFSGFTKAQGTPRHVAENLANKYDLVTGFHVGMLIGDEIRSGRRRIEVRNPAHPSEVVGTIVRGTTKDVQKAVAAAKAAQPAWAALTYDNRARVLGDMLDRLETGIDERAVLLVRENGILLADAKSELASIATHERLILEQAEELGSPVEPPAPKGRTVEHHEPFGVVAGIVPSNSPVGFAFSQIIPALLAGNSIVIVPLETCPLTLMKTINLAAAGLPAGLINVVTGRQGPPCQ